MRSIFFCVCLFFSSISYADWAMDQIREDLRPFQGKKIKKSELLNELKLDRAKKNGLILVEIQNNKVSFSGHLDSCPPRVEVLKAYFYRWLSHARLPDVSFLISLHDSFESSGRFPKEMGSLPIFTFAKHRLAHSVLIPDFEAFDCEDKMSQYEQFCKDHPWDTKKEVCFWRGATTGAVVSAENYRSLPRIQLVMMTVGASSWLDAGLVNLCQGAEKVEQLQVYMKPFTSLKDHFSYKYLIDVDGNSCTYERCRWILLSNSVLVKHQSDNIQWFYKALKAYEHYIPIKNDWSDLYSQYQWLKENDQKAKEIAWAGQKLGKQVFSRKGLESYFETLIREYSTLYLDDTNFLCK